MEAVLPRMAKVSQEWPWVSRETPWVFREWPWMTQAWPWVSWWGEASDGASPCESRGKQGEFRDGGASVWALPCEFRW